MFTFKINDSTSVLTVNNSTQTDLGGATPSGNLSVRGRNLASGSKLGTDTVSAAGNTRNGPHSITAPPNFATVGYTHALGRPAILTYDARGTQVFSAGDNGTTVLFTVPQPWGVSKSMTFFYI